MVTKKKFNYIHELQDIQREAIKCEEAVGLHSLDSSMIIDAKSYIGMYALDFNQPILVVSESEEFHKSIASIGETLES